MNSDLLDLMHGVAEAWNSFACPYGIIHGIEHYPERFGRDIDVLAAPADFDVLANAVELVASRHGFATVRRHHPYGLSIYLTEGYVWESTLEVHFVPRLEWIAVSLAGEVGETGNIGSFKTDPWAGWAKTCLQPLLTNDQRVRPITPCPEKILAANLKRLLGKDIQMFFPEIPEEYSPSLLAGLRNRLRMRLLGRQLIRDPLAFGACLFRFLIRKFSSRWRMAVTIVIAEEDGVRNRGEAESVAKGDVPIFTRVESFRASSRLIHDQRNSCWVFEGDEPPKRLSEITPHVTLVLVYTELSASDPQADSCEQVKLELPWSGPAPVLIRVKKNESGTGVVLYSSLGEMAEVFDESPRKAVATFIRTASVKALFAWLKPL